MSSGTSIAMVQRKVARVVFISAMTVVLLGCSGCPVANMTHREVAFTRRGDPQGAHDRVLRELERVASEHGLAPEEVYHEDMTTWSRVIRERPHVVLRLMVHQAEPGKWSLSISEYNAVEPTLEGDALRRDVDELLGDIPGLSID